jgi:hypothetical protein
MFGNLRRSIVWWSNWLGWLDEVDAAIVAGFSRESRLVGDVDQKRNSPEMYPMVELDGRRHLVDARLTLAELSNHLGTDLSECRDGSINDLLIEAFGRVPELGASASALGIEFIVREVDDGRILQVEVVAGAARPLQRSGPRTKDAASRQRGLTRAG